MKLKKRACLAKGRLFFVFALSANFVCQSLGVGKSFSEIRVFGLQSLGPYALEGFVLS